MAQPGLLQRGLNNLKSTARSARAEGAKGKGGVKEGKLSRLGRSARKSFRAVKRRLGIGFEAIDDYEDDPEEQRHRKRSRALIGDDEPELVTRQAGESRDLNATVAPEYRAQVAAGMIAGNSFTSGSTVIDGGDGGEVGVEGDEGW